jgi:hypothetical protein
MNILWMTATVVQLSILQSTRTTAGGGVGITQFSDSVIVAQMRSTTLFFAAGALSTHWDIVVLCTGVHGWQRANSKRVHQRDSGCTQDHHLVFTFSRPLARRH